jgi:hypothetical protein
MPEAFRLLHTRHLGDLVAQKRILSVALFEALYSYCFVPKHTMGSRLISFRDNLEQGAFAASQAEN